MCFTWVGSSFTHKHCARLERLDRKNTNLLRSFINYRVKKFYSVGPRFQRRF